MDWRRGEPLKEWETELCVHGHFLREEGSVNGTFGAWWAPVHLLIEKAGGGCSVERVYMEFVDDLHDELHDVFASYRAPDSDGSDDRVSGSV